MNVTPSWILDSHSSPHKLLIEREVSLHWGIAKIISLQKNEGFTFIGKIFNGKLHFLCSTIRFNEMKVAISGGQESESSEILFQNGSSQSNSVVFQKSKSPKTLEVSSFGSFFIFRNLSMATRQLKKLNTNSY